MSDLTVFAEALISTVARAFYEDEVVCLIDVLIRDKFLRDDDMAPRLQLPVKKLRATLQFLMGEHIVKEENVDDLHEGGSQATRFFYIDYCTAVHSIRLRLHLLRQKLEKAELQARSSSFYLCPGYKEKRCNGRYTEEEAQRVLDMESGLFLCQECSRNFENDPNAPPLSAYTLQLVDNEKDLKLAMDNLRRLNVQLSAKNIGNHQLRPGIYDLLQKVRGGGGSKSGAGNAGALNSLIAQKIGVAPITSNLPSENFALGIGSTRLAGTGRTAGIKAMKMQKQGLAESSAEARQYLVGGSKITNNGIAGANGSQNSNTTELMFLKSAHGHEIQFTVEKGGGARAQVLAGAPKLSGQPPPGSGVGGAGGYRRRKLLDMAASRVGVALSIPLRVALVAHRKRKRQAQAELEAQQAKRNKSSAVKLAGASSFPEFLLDNIGRGSLSALGKRRGALDVGENGADEEDEDDLENGNHADNLNGSGGSSENLEDEWIEMLESTSEETRLATFQAKYKKEMERQERLLAHSVAPTGKGTPGQSSEQNQQSLTTITTMDDDTEGSQISWEDGFS